LLFAKSGKSNKQSGNSQGRSLTRESLAKLKLRQCVEACGFKDLKARRRKLLELTMRVVKRIHSFLLANLVSKIIEETNHRNGK
jgi:hypothetical protein